MSDESNSGPSGAALRGTGRSLGRSIDHPALVDDLTGLPNRLHFDVVFDVVFEMGDRGVPLSLALFELEFGKDGRPGGAGVEVEVRDFGETLATATRRTDLFARVGEHRFASLLLDCNLQGARIAADRLGDLLDGWRRRTGRTYSVGLTAWRSGTRTPDELWHRAESALDDALRSGGGLVVAAAD